MKYKAENHYHLSVFLERILQTCKQELEIDGRQPQSNLQPGILEGTLGDGGHTLALLSAFPQLSYLTCDSDPEMISRAKQRIAQCVSQKEVQEYQDLSALESVGKFLQENPQRLHIFHSDYQSFTAHLYDLGWQFSFILFDLGLSSYHFDQANRGFSFSDDSLDMRLNPKTVNSAQVWLNEQCNQKQLEDILFAYGEKRFARLIARSIIQERPFYSSSQLATLISRKIYHALGKARSQKSKRRHHLATRSLQAIRIFINQELEQLEKTLEIVPKLLALNGLLSFISFHSLEDRLVKTHFKNLEKTGDFRRLEKKPQRPCQAEIDNNPRARSACLRSIKRIR